MKNRYEIQKVFIINLFKLLIFALIVEVNGGFSFGPNALVVLSVKESYARDQLVKQNSASRKRRALAPVTHTISVRLRTTKQEGVIYWAGNNNDYILIKVHVCKKNGPSNSMCKSTLKTTF